LRLATTRAWEESASMWGMRPTVLIVDDRGGFRASASALLESEGFDVIGEAADGEAAISESDRLRPEG
jgi:DNA-binding NarL/FixJ family response regulator